MFDYIKGNVAEIRGEQLIIECNSIGYLLTVSQNTIGSIGESEEEQKIYTYMNVREDGVTIYGFFEYEELEVFKLLQTVSKIGPKVAIGMLSSLSPVGLKRAIALNDCELLSKAPGIGKKTAERIVLELRDKVDLDEISTKSQNTEIELPEIEASAENEVVEAMVSLGYTKPEVHSILNRIDAEGKSAETLIKMVLKEIGR